MKIVKEEKVFFTNEEVYDHLDRITKDTCTLVCNRCKNEIRIMESQITSWSKKSLDCTIEHLNQLMDDIYKESIIIFGEDVIRNKHRRLLKNAMKMKMKFLELDKKP